MVEKLALIIVCLMVGIIIKQLHPKAEFFSVHLNKYVIWIAYPALVLIKIPQLLSDPQLSLHKLIPFSMPVLHFILAYLAVQLLAPRFGLSRSETGALILTVGLGNTSFVGFPLTEAYFGEPGLKTALLIDQGTFFSMAFLGITTAARFSGKSLSITEVLVRVLAFPPFIALFIAAGLTFTKHSGLLDLPILKLLSFTLAPVALVSIGLRLKGSLGHIHKNTNPLILGLTLKLFVLPAVLSALYWYWLHDDQVARVVAVEAAMAPMITAAIIAEQYHLKRDISQLMVGVGIPVSLITTFAWQLLVKSF